MVAFRQHCSLLSNLVVVIYPDKKVTVNYLYLSGGFPKIKLVIVNVLFFVIVVTTFGYIN